MNEAHHEQVPYLTLSGVAKSFGGHMALHPVQLRIARGEFHALIGENGAGKSTLINLITGVYPSDAGTISVNGEAHSSLTPGQANKLGIYAVHQELSLCSHLTIAQNIFLGREWTGPFGRLRKKAMRTRAAELMREVELGHLDPETPVHLLTLAQQQMIEFIKAVDQNPALLVLDEATSALDPTQVDIMFGILRKLKEEGMAVIFISHRLQELFDLCDRMTVLKDGQWVATDDIGRFNHSNLIELMTGRQFTDLFPAKPDIDSVMRRPEVLVVDGLKSDKVQEASFVLHEGEILGIGGLQGQGQEEILKALFGAAPVTGGKITWQGRTYRARNTRQAMEQDIAYIPADRKTESLLLPHSIRFNTSLVSLNRISNRWGTVKSREENGIVERSMERLQVKAQNQEQPVGALSGGNQQKVAMNKCLEREPRLLLLNEPTRGIDVGTKKQIYELLRAQAERGVSIIMVSSDALELIGMCDRVLVIYEHQVNGELMGEQLTERNLVRASVIKQGG
ncbi:sugar ABC transporter ATP-binding protein [Cohnella caldifontis]|uniref:sugar ABC transporter ATP-binding protein n=1 Tax=Cohnella caldifontis TaxID=3027471 RepID=UPI0023ED8EAB|nr:sugar ABC transporter ATP-binding protein [Cohnella sp. YIM B05605]